MTSKIPLRPTTGFCGFCGTPLDTDGARLCTCRPRSNLERVVANAAVLSAARPRSRLRTSLREAASIRIERTH